MLDLRLSIYLPSENYGRNFKRIGYTDNDIGDGGSNRMRAWKRV